MKHICTHHIGGRAGNRAFPVLDSFEKDFVNVLYDADRDCIAQIEARNKKLQSELIVLPFFFGEKNKEKAVFNITYDPYASSHREFNKEYDSWYFYFRREEYDYILSEATKTVEKRVQKMVTLDGLLTKNTSPPPPDILSLDVQGMEYEVLQGAKKVLKSNVLAIITEIEFLPLYKGQKLFGDIFSLLKDKGFHFVKFLKIAEFSPYRAAIGLRGEGFQSWGDALFFRKIEDIKNIKDLSIQQEMLDKLAFISIVFHQFEYALECIKQSKECRKLIGLDKDDEKKYSYIKMLREIEIEVENLKKGSLQLLPINTRLKKVRHDLKYIQFTEKMNNNRLDLKVKILKNMTIQTLRKYYEITV